VRFRPVLEVFFAKGRPLSLEGNMSGSENTGGQPSFPRDLKTTEEKCSRVIKHQ